MDHMTELEIIDLLHGEGTSEAEAHLKRCADCRSLHELWTERIDGLRAMSNESLDESEIHRLRVLFRHLGPSESRGSQWIATLVRSSHAAPADARGHVPGEIMEYSAGPFNVLLQFGSRGSHSKVSVIGQIGTVDGEDRIGGTFSVSSGTGHDHFSDVDEFGEFNFDDLPAGSYRGTWWFEDQILIVPSIEIGSDDEP